MSRPTESFSGGYGVRARAGALAPGGVVGDGRYRLLAQFGEDARASTQFWRARDGQLSRDVALSVIVGNPADSAAAHRARRILDRATHTASFEDAVVARVIDVLTLGGGVSGTEGVLGMIVAEWSPGTDLVDLVADGPVTPGAATALLEPITAAVEQAHQTGVVLGVDHPQRVRVTRDGALRLAFPGALPEATLRDDVRGLGALLYLLLTGRWPLPGGPEALPPAPTAPDGALVAPRTLVPGTPQELSQLAVRCLSDDRNTVGGIRTSAAILAVLERVGDEDVAPQTMVAGPVTGQQQAVRDNDTTVWTTKRPQRDPVQRKRLAIAVGVLGVATVAVLVWLVVGVIGFFSGDSQGGPPPVTATAQPTPKAQQPAPPPPPTSSAPIPPAGVAVYNVSGDVDGASTVRRVMDGDPGTTWKTQEYFDNFPSLKPGVGVLSRLPQPMTIGQVNIDSPSAGAKVEIRTTDSNQPNLDNTQLVGEGPLVNGQTQIKLAPHPPSKYLLVWITSLVQDGGRWDAQIGELHFVPTG